MNKLNMDSWLKEKSGNVVNNLATLIDILKRNESMIPKEVYEEIMYELYPTLIDSTKVYGFAYESPQTGREGELIFNKGSIGLEDVMYKLGIISKTSEMKKIEDLEELITRLEDLSDGDKSNRTLVHEALAKYQNKLESINDDVEKLKDLIERVTLGISNWETFVTTSQIIIQNLKYQLDTLKNKHN